MNQPTGYYYHDGAPKSFTRRAFMGMTAGATALMTLAGFKCDKASEVARQAELLLSTVRAAVPIVRAFAPATADKLAQALPIAEKLRVAVEANDQSNAVAYIREFIPVFVDVIDHDVPQLSEALQQKVLVALALGDIALAFLSNFYLTQTASTKSIGPDVIAGYARRAHFGYKYVK